MEIIKIPKLTYSVDGEWLVCNGERVLWCPGASAEEMEAIRDQYQRQADEAYQVGMELYKQNLRQSLLTQLKEKVTQMLSETDWVVIKLQSMKEEGWSEAEIENEKQKYVKILAQRKAIREWNLKMKQIIQNAQTVEELEGIKIEFTE